MNALRFEILMVFIQKFPVLPDFLVGDIKKVGMRDIGHDFNSLVADVGKNGDRF